MINDSKTPRRNFLEKLALGAGAAVAIPTLLSPFDALASFNPVVAADADEWFKKVKGKHKIVFDAPDPHNGFPVAWPFVFYKTNNATGTADTDMTAVVVLRHSAIPLAMEDKIWDKYKLGDRFHITDSDTNASATKNVYAMTTEPLFKMLGIDGIKALIARGVMFCVCDVAVSVHSGMMAKAMNANPDEVKKEWVDGLIPGVQLVPSGVWAVGRAQEKGCAYCFAGGKE
jgi:intracellular sulfur oxidation DsrE/DsrF family protein